MVKQVSRTSLFAKNKKNTHAHTSQTGENKKEEENKGTFWSPPPVAKRWPPGWMSMEKICSPSWRIQAGFSVIISHGR
jgi:hypothetical protein